MDHGDIASTIRNQIKPALIIFLLLTLITGIFYPLLITGIAQLIFPVQANGNLIIRDGKIVGSALIGQPFTSPEYFWGRLSATTPVPYNACFVVRIEPGTIKPGSPRRSEHQNPDPPCGRSGQHAPRPDRSCHFLGERA